MKTIEEIVVAVVDALDAEGIGYLLVGSFSSTYYSTPRSTNDADFVVHLEGKSILNPYGLKSDAELFAVSVESFFQDSLRLRLYHTELYSLLSDFFNQDPASRLLAHHATFMFRPWFALGPTQRPVA